MAGNTKNPFVIGTSPNPDLAGSGRFGLNDSGTCGKIDTRLTQPRSRSVPAPYECGVGQPPMNCNVCGGRVPGNRCDRHPREPGFVALRDKHSKLFVIRTPTSQDAGS